VRSPGALGVSQAVECPDCGGGADDEEEQRLQRPRIANAPDASSGTRPRWFRRGERIQRGGVDELFGVPRRLVAPKSSVTLACFTRPRTTAAAGGGLRRHKRPDDSVPRRKVAPSAIDWCVSRGSP